jgi:hypothetical protein
VSTTPENGHDFHNHAQKSLPKKKKKIVSAAARHFRREHITSCQSFPASFSSRPLRPDLVRLLRTLQKRPATSAAPTTPQQQHLISVFLIILSSRPVIVSSTSGGEYGEIASLTVPPPRIQHAAHIPSF